jgi:HPt (histidine-containing phosphotransfer) domain-containing protein
MEKPNLDYINQLCEEDEVFKKKMIGIIQKELPVEIEAYRKSIEDMKYKLAAECVHKLKHKISILGLEKSYYIAHEYEDFLLNGKTECRDEFENILQLIQNFINDQ